MKSVPPRLDLGPRVAAVEDAISKGGEKLYLTGMCGALSLYRGAPAATAKDFHPENGVYLGGGLKRGKLPDNYREFVYETFNLQPRFIYQMYSMQELNSSMPRCQARPSYHLPTWLVCLPLTRKAKRSPKASAKTRSRRAAFFDLPLDGRWGGVIYSPCAFGNAWPSLADDVCRYADLEGEDKIGCAGTGDAYVRGMS